MSWCIFDTQNVLLQGCEQAGAAAGRASAQRACQYRSPTDSAYGCADADTAVGRCSGGAFG